MGGLLRKLAIYLCAPIYKLIPQIYQIFYILSNHRFFEDDTIDRLSSNIYVLVSVVMLFAFSANILAAIVNPDLMNDKKKGVGAMFKRAIIGLALIIIIPFGFDEAYVIQREVVSKNLIEKIVVGVNYADGSCTNGGQVIAGTLLSSVLHPDVADGEELEVSEKVATRYNTMIKTDIKDIEVFKMHINVDKGTTDTNESFHWDSSNENYAFKFDGLIALIAGGVCCYLLITFAIDMAVRIFKLAFLELTSPIIVISYMSAGDQILKKWFQETLKTFLDVFVRIACMAFFIFLVGHLDGFLDNVKAAANLSAEGCEVNNFGIIDMSFLKVLLIIGMLIFIKQIPDFVNKVFGINIQSKGGIKGRLGEMAVGGKLAQGAWNMIKNGAMLGMGAVGLAPAALTGAGIGFVANRATHGDFMRGLRTAGKAVGTAVKTATPVVKGLASDNPITAIPNAVKGYQGTDFAKNRVSNRKQNRVIELQDSIGLDDIGSLTTENNNIAGAEKVKKNLESALQNSNISSNARKVLAEKIDIDRTNSVMQKLKTANDEIKNLLSTASSNAKTVEARNKIENLRQNYIAGNENLDTLTAKLNDFVSEGTLSEGSAKSIVSQINKIDSITQSKEFEEVNKNAKILVNEDGKVTIKSTLIGVHAKKAEERTKVHKEKYDTLLAGVSEREKEEIESLVKVADSANSEYARVNSEKRGDQYNYSINSTSPNTQTQTQTQTQQNVNSSDLDDDVWEQISEVQAQVNEDRLDSAWRNQNTDNTYERGTYEPERTSRNNENDSSYDDIYSQYYENDDTNDE